jgi:regulator of RNase E activity RraA
VRRVRQRDLGLTPAIFGFAASIFFLGYMVGDDDGVLCVPYALSQTVLRDANAKKTPEDGIMKTIQAGRATGAGWMKRSSVWVVR